MVKKIINSKGGLHNRITLKLKLEQFNLRETKEYLESMGINWDNKTIVGCYMAMGNVRYTYQLCDFFTLFYFQFMKKGKTYDTETWIHQMGKPAMNTWAGLAPVS